ncbi:hypothetical protein AYO45_05050 [Gammaproteobacteria bacterium SCGC AG-212-F23]|nr:hypothetical protein AYO45_05050 [Gammaproteobacteria bacterium SCGC AG-212-F23]
MGKNNFFLLIVTLIFFVGCYQEKNQVSPAFIALENERILSPEKFGEKILRAEMHLAQQQEILARWQQEYKTHPQDKSLAEKIHAAAAKNALLEKDIQIWLQVIAMTSGE